MGRREKGVAQALHVGRLICDENRPLWGEISKQMVQRGLAFTVVEDHMQDPVDQDQIEMLRGFPAHDVRDNASHIKAFGLRIGLHLRNATGRGIKACDGMPFARQRQGITALTATDIKDAARGVIIKGQRLDDGRGRRAKRIGFLRI